MATPPPSGSINLEIRIVAPESTDARWCLHEYFLELAARFETGFDPGKGNPVANAEMTPPAGYFFLARLGGAPVGCAVLLRRDETTGEIKRMWTAPSARGSGIAPPILRTLESKARECGLTTLRLDTNRVLEEAQAFYRKEGYLEVAAFNQQPYAHLWFEKRV